MKTSLTTISERKRDFIRRVTAQPKQALEEWHESYMHVDTESGNTDFLCSICGKVYVQVGEHLKKHYYAHLERREINMAVRRFYTVEEIVTIYKMLKRKVPVAFIAEKVNRPMSSISTVGSSIRRAIDAETDAEASAALERQTHIGAEGKRCILKAREMIRQGMIDLDERIPHDDRIGNDVETVSISKSQPIIPPLVSDRYEKLEKAFEMFQDEVIDFIESEVEERIKPIEKTTFMDKLRGKMRKSARMFPVGEP